MSGSNIIRERTTVGGGVVKVLILQFFSRYGNGLHMKPQITTVQNTTFSAEMLSSSKNAFFLFSILENKTCLYSLYTMILMPALNSALYCCTYYHMYIYVSYIYTHTIWQVYCFFTIVYVSRKICIWYWTDMSAISSCEFCIFWKVFCILSCCSWVLFTKEHVQIEHAPLQKMV